MVRVAAVQRDIADVDQALGEMLGVVEILDAEQLDILAVLAEQASAMRMRSVVTR